MILDCCEIDVKSVEYQVQVESSTDPPTSNLHFEPLPFSITPVSLSIALPQNRNHQTQKIRVSYTTHQNGPSLQWCLDSDNNPFVFTCGAACNNRSLFPSPDAPSELCTYYAMVQVPSNYTVLMSSTFVRQLEVSESDDFQTCIVSQWEYKLETPLMCSTVVLAAGKFRSSSLPAMRIPITIYGPVKSTSVEMLSTFIPQYLTTAEMMLGSVPFSRYDALIMPRAFSSLGMQNPYLAFFSQSLCSKDRGMRNRVAHEIAHLYFGLLIGPRDWNEEWLSEGFATYMEDRIVYKAEGINENQQKLLTQIKWELKFRTLQNDIQNTEENMQRLMPKVGDSSAPCALDTSHRCHTIHYVKSYFLLHLLAQKAGGCEIFDKFLRAYVDRYQNKLVSSADFLDFYFASFPQLRNVGVFDTHVVLHSWVYSPGVPSDALDSMFSQAGCQFGLFPAAKIVNPLVRDVQVAYDSVLTLNRTLTESAQNATEVARSCVSVLQHSAATWEPEQLCLLLDKLVDWVGKSEDNSSASSASAEQEASTTVLSSSCLSLLQQVFAFWERNPEAQHRWCELVIKCKYEPDYPNLKKFLQDHQGMGLYVFGELLVSGVCERELAVCAYNANKHTMDRELRTRCEELILQTEG
ncbi:Aminopeptidase O [Pelomyxa schiedti]|nr:Aminopeptidase O [Pelomyxa schiedti]